MKNFKNIFLLLLLIFQQSFGQIDSLRVSTVVQGNSYIINGVSTGVGIIAEEIAPLKLRIIDSNSRNSTLYNFNSLDDITVDGITPATIEEAVKLINSVTNIVNFNQNYYLQVTKGLIPGKSIVTKFGRNANVGTSLTQVSIGGVYQTPMTAQSLEILSSDAADNPAGIGAHKVVIGGLDGNWDAQIDTITLNGLTPVAVPKQFTRVYRAHVLESGSYATVTTPSQIGQITLRGAGAGVTWFIIDTVEGTASGWGIGQTQIGSYSIAKGYTGYLLSKTFSVEAAKPASLYFFRRGSIDDVTPPYTGTMRLFEENDGIEVPFSVIGDSPLATIKGPAELGFFAKVNIGTASVSVEFQLLVEKDN